MITFTKFGNYGRLGNQLFQYASMLGIAKDNDTDVVLPRWEWSSYFENEPTIRNTPIGAAYNEPNFHYAPVYLASKDIVYDFCGWFQSEKYWLHCKDYIMDMLSFKPHFLQTKYLMANAGTNTIAISIRRGDYVDNPNYELLNADYYYLALLEHFPDWRDYNILIFSDDIPYCKVHFQCLPNVFFIEDLNPMEQLILGSMCDNFIIANSTFSWWMAYLGEKEHSKIIRPNYLFAGELLKNNDWKDFYPERWTTFDHKGKKLDFKDCTFTIPFHLDSKDREENFMLIVDNLMSAFDTVYAIGDPAEQYGVFHRTKWLNEAAKKSVTPYVINYDCDILTPPLQLFLAIEQLRNNQADMVYPYDGRFARVPRTWLPTVQKYNDVGMFKNTEFVGCRPYDGASVGGVIAYRKDRFIESGGENEKMVSYGSEDVERFKRWQILGYRVTRIKGCVYHLDHVITMNSSTTHPDFVSNEQESLKVQRMNQTDLRAYVDSWGYFQ